jgi:hypothetical protein
VDGPTEVRPDACDGPTLDRLTAAFGAVDAAIEYGYDSAAAVNAATALLASLDRADLLAVAALLAGFAATDLRPRCGPADLSWWSSHHGFLLAMTERP